MTIFFVIISHRWLPSVLLCQQWVSEGLLSILCALCLKHLWSATTSHGLHFHFITSCFILKSVFLSLHFQPFPHPLLFGLQKVLQLSITFSCSLYFPVFYFLYRHVSKCSLHAWLSRTFMDFDFCLVLTCLSATLPACRPVHDLGLFLQLCVWDFILLSWILCFSFLLQVWKVASGDIKK